MFCFASLGITLTVPEVVGTENWVNSHQPFLLDPSNIVKVQSCHYWLTLVTGSWLLLLLLCSINQESSCHCLYVCSVFYMHMNTSTAATAQLEFLNDTKWCWETKKLLWSFLNLIRHISAPPNYEFEVWIVNSYHIKEHWHALVFV